MAGRKAFVLAICIIAASLPGRSQTTQARTIMFVCEHGSAKSIIAAAHFNRMAESKGLPYRAISRGVQPDGEIPGYIKAGLLADGLDISGWKPKLVADDDIRQAERVITLGCELPKSRSVTASKVVDWNSIPAMSSGFTGARTAIVQRIEELFKTLPDTKPRQ